MKNLVTLALVIIGLSLIRAAEFKHPVGNITIPGDWEKDPDSTDEELVLNSRPEGQQVIIGLRKARTEIPKKKFRPVIDEELKIRRRLAEKVSGGDVALEEPVVTESQSGATGLFRAFDRNHHVRLAVRIDVSRSGTRYSSIYDYSGKSAEEFTKYSKSVFDAVK